ncbi:hypothetical protein SGLAM104S_08397 [Streptomyces glaucescens]
MLRHEFQPGRLVAGCFLTVAGVVYAGDAGGAWEAPWFVAFPLVVGGLCLAGAAGVLSRSIRRRGRNPGRPASPGRRLGRDGPPGAGTGKELRHGGARARPVSAALSRPSRALGFAPSATLASHPPRARWKGGRRQRHGHHQRGEQTGGAGRRPPAPIAVSACTSSNSRTSAHTVIVVRRHSRASQASPSARPRSATSRRTGSVRPNPLPGRRRGVRDRRRQPLSGRELVTPAQERGDGPPMSLACPVRAVLAGTAARVDDASVRSGLPTLSRLPHRHARRPPFPATTPRRPYDAAVQLPCDDSELCPTPGRPRLTHLVRPGEIPTTVLTRPGEFR